MPDIKKVPKVVSGVKVVHWNPRRHHLPRPLGRVRFGARVNNFGDLLGPVIVERLCQQRGYVTREGSSRLVTVGSIMHAVRDGDVVWGTGVNGKTRPELTDVRNAQFEAVRGPLTRQFMIERGHDVPEVFGDPAILVPDLFPEWNASSAKTRGLGFLPNLHDLPTWSNQVDDLISPHGHPADVIPQIIACDRLVTSSLHGMIIADAYGIPVVLVKPVAEHEFKYLDYARGVRRAEPDFVDTLDRACEIVDEAQPAHIEAHVKADLLDAFPAGLWKCELA